MSEKPTDFELMLKMIKQVHARRENVEDKYYNGVPLIIVCAHLKIGLHKAYLLAKQAGLYDPTIKYRKGKVCYDGNIPDEV